MDPMNFILFCGILTSFALAIWCDNQDGGGDGFAF